MEAAPSYTGLFGVDPALSLPHPVDVADNQIAPALIEELPEEARFVLGDTHYDALRTYARSASRGSGFWSPPNVALSHTLTPGWR